MDPSLDNNILISCSVDRCRPHVSGRQCNQPDQAFYAGLMDYNVYEAENAFGSDVCSIFCYPFIYTFKSIKSIVSRM